MHLQAQQALTNITNYNLEIQPSPTTQFITSYFFSHAFIIMYKVEVLRKFQPSHCLHLFTSLYPSFIHTHIYTFTKCVQKKTLDRDLLT
jgi:hypothetical protein